MAPEVALGSPAIDGRADLYSLGCVAYWLLTGQVVFDAPSAVAMVIAHLQTPPVPPSQRTELEVPDSLILILQLLEKDLAKRPQTAREWPKGWRRARESATGRKRTPNAGGRSIHRNPMPLERPCQPAPGMTL